MDLELLESLSNKKTPFFLAGIDEVGRGPLAGPVVCACAALEISNASESDFKSILEAWSSLGVTDSKKLTSKKRVKILKELGIDLENLKATETYTLEINNYAQLKFSISEISHTIVDEMNILAASLFGMSKSFYQLDLQTDGEILIDGNKIPKELENENSSAIVKGDSKSSVIALASIIAKEYRDLLMQKMAIKYPGYGLESHAGYPTKAHKEALINLGVTPIHRKTFKGVKELLA